LTVVNGLQQLQLIVLPFVARHVVLVILVLDV
jgi:hypothetical protein